MVDINQSNSGEQGVNAPEKKLALSTKLLREFARDKISNGAQRASFVTQLRNDGDISADMLQEIENFARRNREYDDLEVSADTMKYSILNREISSYFATLANYKQELRDMIVTEYDITPTDLRRISDTQINALEEPELKRLIESDTRRKEFLRGLCGTHFFMPVEKSLATFLKDFDLVTKYEKYVPEDKKPDFGVVVEKIQTGQKLDTIDIEILLESGVFSDEQQRRLLEKLLPSMSLKKAQELRLINDREIRSFKEGLVRKIFEGDTIDTQAIAGEIPNDELIFSTEALLGNKEYREAIIDDPLIFEPFVKRYSSFIDEVNQEIDGKTLKKKSDFIERLSLNPKVSGANTLTIGSIIEIHQSQKGDNGQPEEKIIYGEISSLSDNGEFIIKERGVYDKNTQIGGYNIHTRGTGSHKYGEFLEFSREGNSVKGISVDKINIYSPGELQDKISSGEVPEGSGDSIAIQESSVLNAQIGTLSQQIEAAERNLVIEKDRVREELQIARRAGRNSFSDAEIEQEIERNEYIQKLRQEIEELEQRRSQKQEEINNLDDNNFETLKQAIDGIDDTGIQYGFEVGVTFQTKDDVYTITHIDKIGKTISILGVTGEETGIDFQDFFLNFKKQDAQRVSNVRTFDELFEKNQSHSDAWKGFVLKDGEIRKKGKADNATESGVVYDYLVSQDGKQIVKIEDISGGKVTISFGELEEKPEKKVGVDGKEKWDQNKKYKMFGGSSNMIFDVSYLDAFIKKYNLAPESLNKDNEKQDPDDIAKMKKKFHIFSFLFQNISIMEAVKGGKMFVEQIKEIMSQGQEEHALQFANMYLGKMLPKGGRQELQVRLENSQKKRMEEYLDRLRNVGSDIATDMIQGYLQDKYGPQYPKEAAVVFMLEKYGVLNAKGLADWEGHFRWYQALGGEVNDELYNEVKAEVADESLPFTEEYLVYRLMKKQCGPNGYKGIKRRSKLHKEIKKLRAKGKEEERETGMRDGGDQRTIEGRVEGCMGELKSGNYPNAVGWLEKAIDKGGDMVVMNKVPFIMAFSGIAYHFEEKVTDDLKNFPAKSRVAMMLRFFSYHRDLDLLNGTIMRVCELLGQRGGKFEHIESRARKIFNNRRSAGIKQKINDTEKFYSHYGKEITDIMYMLNTGDSDDTLSKLIFFEKDKPGNEILKKYYETLHTFIDADTSFEDEGLMSDAFAKKGVSGLNLNKVTKQMLGMRQGGSFSKHTSAPIMVEEIRKEFEAIPRRRYSDDEQENREMQKKLLKDNLRMMIAGFLELHGSHPTAMSGYNAPSSPLQFLNKWGVYLEEFVDLPGGANYEDVLHNTDEKYNPLFEKFANQIIESETTGIDFSKPDKYSDKTVTASSIGDSVSRIVSNRGGNPNQDS